MGVFFYRPLPTSVIARGFTESVSAATLAIGIILVCVTGFFAWKTQSGLAANERADEWRNEYGAVRSLLEEKEERLTKQLADAESRYQEQRALKHEALTEKAALEKATDLRGVMQAISELGERMSKSEERLTERFDLFAATLATLSNANNAQTKALEAIAGRLSETP